MGTRGPIPKSKELKLHNACSGKRRVRANTSSAADSRSSGGAPRCPDWLDAETRAVWRVVVADLKASGILDRLDAQSLACYCQTYVRWKKAEEFLAKHGEVFAVKDEAGRVKYLQQVPQVAIARSCLEILTRYQREFGMTPAARARLSLEPEEQQDEFEAFLATRQKTKYSAS